MTYHEKRSVVSIISSLLITILYFWYVFNNYYSELIGNNESLSTWGKVFLIFIVASIIANIIIYIIFHIIYRITDKEEAPCFSDERDKLIELKASRISLWIFVSGFIIAMGLLALDMSISTMFIVLIFSGLISSITGDISQIYFYRKGI